MYKITMKLLNFWRPLVLYIKDKYFKILLFTYHQKKKIIFTDNAQTVLRQQMTTHGMNA